MEMPRKKQKIKINKMLGRAKRPDRKSEPIVHVKLESYPIRKRPLGVTAGGPQGVGGWRSAYHRVEDVKLDGSDFSGSYAAMLRENRR